MVTQTDVDNELSRWWESDNSESIWVNMDHKIPMAPNLQRQTPYIFSWGFKFSSPRRTFNSTRWPVALIEGHEQKGQNKGGEQTSCAGLPKEVDWI